MIVPDSIEPYIGWKSLRFCRYTHKLYSPLQDSLWPHGRRLEAVCAREWATQWEWVAAPLDQVISSAPHLLTRHGSSGPHTLWTSQSSNVNAFLTAMIQKGASFLPMPTEDPPEGHTWIPQPTGNLVRHTPAHEHCSCGIYAVDNPMRCSSYLQNDCVLVQVAVWGNTVIGEHGVRGQYAYPQKLIVPEHNLAVGKKIAERYQIPCEVARKELSREWVTGRKRRSSRTYNYAIAAAGISCAISSSLSLANLSRFSIIPLSISACALVIAGWAFFKNR